MVWRRRLKWSGEVLSVGGSCGDSTRKVSGLAVRSPVRSAFVADGPLALTSIRGDVARDKASKMHTWSRTCTESSVSPRSMKRRRTRAASFSVLLQAGCSNPSGPVIAEPRDISTASTTEDSGAPVWARSCAASVRSPSRTRTCTDRGEEERESAALPSGVEGAEFTDGVD